MKQQTVEVRFQGELVGSHDDGTTTYTLYRVPGNVYVVYVAQEQDSWLETMGGQGLSDGQVKTFFPQLAADGGLN